MDKYENMRKIIKEENNDVLFLAHEFNEALMGSCLIETNKAVAVYDTDIYIRILIKNLEIEELEALKKLEDCILYYYGYPNHPVFINDFRRIKMVNLEHLEPTDTIEDLS
ncbi:MAG: hypothetical protein ACTSSP_00175 [Candidatus Asgardarchaeia archaeon]